MKLPKHQNNPLPYRRQNHPASREGGLSVKMAKNTSNFVLTQPLHSLLPPGKYGVIATSALSNPAKTARIFNVPSPKPL